MAQTRESFLSRIDRFAFAVELVGLAAAKETDRPSTDDDVDRLPKVIGVCGAGVLPEIGYMYNKSYWGNGYATEALQGFLELYWKTYPDGFPGLEAEDKDIVLGRVNEDNLPSQAVLKKCGFEFWRELEVEDKSDKTKIVKLYEYRLWRPGMGKSSLVRDN